MEYDVQFICCSCKITDTLAKKGFQKTKKYSIMGATNKKELLSKCSEKLEKARLVELCIIYAV